MSPKSDKKSNSGKSTPQKGRATPTKGRATPTKGRGTPTKGAKNKDDDKLAVEEEELRARIEQEEEERRLAKEAAEKLEAERLEILKSIQEKEQVETVQELESIHSSIEKVERDRKANAEWNRYMKCDGKPDPSSVKEINTFITLTKEKINPDINVVLEEANLILELIDELKFTMEDKKEEIPPDELADHKQTIMSLQELLFFRYNAATFKLLREATYEADSETGNLQKVITGDNELLMLWGNLNKNPRFKSFEFENENFQFELPKVLAMADIAIRVLKTDYDHYSHLCSTFLPKVKTKPAIEVVVEEPLVEETKEEAPPEETEDSDDKKSIAPSDGRKSSVSAQPEATQEAEDKPATIPQVEETAEGMTAIPEVKTEEVDLDDILDPDIVDLRQFTPLGGVYHIDLLQMPPQPKIVKGWTLTQISDKPLTDVKYPAETPLGRTLSRVGSATHEPREEDGNAAKTPQEQLQPPIGLKMRVPSNVMFFEEPQVAKWDSTDKHWKTDLISDSVYDEKERTLSFKTTEFGIFSLSQDAHLNMPFQSWELRPNGVDSAILTVTAAIAEARIEIKGSECRLLPPEEDPPTELTDLYDKWMTSNGLIEEMKRAGVNVFPAVDSPKFVSVQKKDVNLDLVYEQMALFSSAFAFMWSKWNNEMNKDRIILQAAPFYIVDQSQALKSVPDDAWSTFAVGNDRCYKLALTEFEDVFSDAIAPESSYHCDLMHAMRMTSLRGDPDGKTLEALVDRSKSAHPFFVRTVLNLLQATKLISYS